jgi:signal transduction histidine kinase
MKRIFDSLYARLLFVYGLTFLTLVLSIGFAFRVSAPPEVNAFFQVQIKRYSEYLAREVGAPASPERARRLATELGLAIQLRSADGAVLWTEGSSGDAFPSRHPKKFSTPLADGTMLFFAPRFWREHDRVLLGLLIAALLSAVVMAVSYRAIRKVFSPLRDMEPVLSAWRTGDYAVRLPVVGSREFRSLAKQINSMASRVQGHLAAQRELMIAVSHELRSPLARVQVAAEMLGDARAKESIQEEVRALDRLTGLLLERERMSLGEAGLHWESAPVSVWADRALDALGSQKTRVSLEFPDEVWSATGRWDIARLTLAVHGVLENALKFSDQRSTVYWRGSREGGALRMEIQDQGPGFPEEMIARVGQPLLLGAEERGTDRKTRGFGMGLSIAVACLHAHGGSLEVENLEHGCRITLRLPLT